MLRTELPRSLSRRPLFREGDCLSAMLFIYYFALCALDSQFTLIHTITKGPLINPSYTDDQTLACTNEPPIDDTETIMVKRLTDYDLKVNATRKNDKIPRPPSPTIKCREQVTTTPPPE